MIVSGMTIVCNGVKLGYPFVESIKSVLPLCDEYIVVAGRSDDATLEVLKCLDDPKIRIVESIWSEKNTPRRTVISQQTNIGLHLCRGDWVICLQANELIHEGSHAYLRETMKRYVDDSQVEAILLERLTFWGDFNQYLNVYPHRFKYSPRIVKPYKGVYSIRDGMSFGVFEGFSLRGRYPRAVDSGVDVFRYGYVCYVESLAGKDEEAVHMRDNIGREFGEDYFYKEYPKQFVSKYVGSHPDAIAARQAQFGQAILLDDERWRTDLTIKERQRLLESRYYAKYGIPWFRHTRYKLIAGYRSKKRQEVI